MVDCFPKVASDDPKVNMAKKDEANELPEGFVPAELDVICGWARQNYHHGKFVACFCRY
jgi:hypothetical protein